MDVLRFIGWWWNKRNGPEKVVATIILSFLFLVPGMFIFGIKAIQVFFCVFLLILGSWGLYGLWSMIREQWIEYQNVREQEAQQIVRRLRGS